MEELLPLTQEWDKTFPRNPKIGHRKVTFRNRYGIVLAADLVHAGRRAGEMARLGGLRSFWGGKGASLRPVRPGYGRAGLPDHRL